MNLNMIQPKNETESSLLSLIKNCESLIKQIHRKSEETLEFKMNKPRETFHFKPPISLEESWMIGLTNIGVYNTFLNITDHNNNFDLYTDTFDEFSFEELKDKLEEILDIPNITDEHLQDEVIGPRINSAYKKLATEQGQTDGYVILLMGYISFSRF